MTKKIDRKLNGIDIVEKEFGDFIENGGTIGGSIILPNAEIYSGNGKLFRIKPNDGAYLFLSAENSENTANKLCELALINRDDKTGFAFRPTTNGRGATDIGGPYHKFANAYFSEDVFIGGVSKARDGYVKLSNGMILQWGSIIGTSTTTGTVNYPIAFPNSVFQVMGTINRGDAVTHTCNINSTMANNKSFTWYSDKAINAGIALMWIAIGH